MLAGVLLLAALVADWLGSAWPSVRRSGFDLFFAAAGFQVGEGWLEVDPAGPLWRAFAAGLLNTLRVALPAIVLAALIGLLAGAVQAAPLVVHPLLQWLGRVYVDALRNVPLLVQLLAWYFLLTHLPPPGDQPWELFGPGSGCFLSKGGLALPGLQWPDAGGWIPAWDWPRPTRFNVDGGVQLTPEYLALLLGLSLYTAAYMAETVRAGIEAVPAGQWLAARALGLGRRDLLRHVVLPQAARAIWPAWGNHALNLTKNSSLAVAVGYPDLVSVTHTALNQTGRSLECMAVMLGMYLLLSGLTAAAVHLQDRRSRRWAGRT